VIVFVFVCEDMVSKKMIKKEITGRSMLRMK
jgi:hypothetical protein